MKSTADSYCFGFDLSKLFVNRGSVHRFYCTGCSHVKQDLRDAVAVPLSCIPRVSNKTSVRFVKPAAEIHNDNEEKAPFYCLVC